MTTMSTPPSHTTPPLSLLDWKPKLALFDPDDLSDSSDCLGPAGIEPGAPSTPRPADFGPDLKLRQWYERQLLPKLLERVELGQRSARTLEEYEIALGHWERKASYPLESDPTVNAIDPPVRLINESIVSAFRRKLLKDPFTKGKSTARNQRANLTVNKVMRHLRAIVRTLFPPDSHNPNGAGIVPLFPWPEELKRQGTLTFTFSRKELSALYLACGKCKSASKYACNRSPMHNPDKWRTALVLALNAGPRTWDLFGLKWSAIKWDKFKHGAVWFQSRKTAKIQMVPLNRESRIHLEHLRKLFPTDEFIFQGFKKDSTFYRSWERITAAAKVTAPFESMRKTCSTLHDDVRHGVGAFLLGHSPRGVNATSYDNPTPRVMRTVYKLKCPAEFRRGAFQIRQLKGNSQSS